MFNISVEKGLCGCRGLGWIVSSAGGLGVDEIKGGVGMSRDGNVEGGGLG